MPTDRRVPTLVVNTLTEAQYQALENPSDTEMWVTPYNQSHLQNTATGTNALTIEGTPAATVQSNNIGIASSAGNYSVSTGYSATATSASTAIGTRATAGNYGVAIGSADRDGVKTEASGSSSVAIGYNSKATANTAVQIGTGTNNTAGTVQIKGTRILDANGKIPTANLDVEKVSKTGDTMTGALTISKAADHISAQDTVLDVNATPLSNLNGGYYSIRDKNGNLITRLYASNTTDGYNISALQAWSGTSANTSASIGIRMKQDGTSAFAFCPTPASSSNDNQIATTAWVKGEAWSFPSTTYDEITVGASQATYTAQYDGWIFLKYNVNSTASGFVTVVQNEHADQQVYLGAAYNSVYLFTPINAGNFSIAYGNVTIVHVRLFRAKRYV